MNPVSRLIAALIQKKLGPYKQVVNHPDPSRPEKISEKKSVAVIGAGLAGISAASLLGERGFQVDIYDKNPVIGGKIAAWQHTFEDGFSPVIEHGFHAFFPQYYNLWNFIHKIGAANHMIPIDDYLIIYADGKKDSFKTVLPVPGLNILSMLRHGFFSIAEILTHPRTIACMDLLRYNPEKTLRRYDAMSFAEFVEKADLPTSLQRTFTCMTRAFFAEPNDMSMAELIKSFHFYFLSNDKGLLYKVPNDDFETTLLTPIRTHLAQHGVTLKLNTPVKNIEKSDSGFTVHDRDYEQVILAADIPGAQRILADSPWINPTYPAAYNALQKPRPSKGYAVLRIWTDTFLKDPLPHFFFLDRLKLLDSVAQYHQFETQSALWAQQNNGGIYELHSYALSDNLTREDIQKTLLEEFRTYFPETAAMTIRYEYLQVRYDFPAYSPGYGTIAPSFKTDIPGLYVAGDWVKLPVPASLMEKAYTAGLFCANDILEKYGLKTEPVYSVPLKGMLA